MSSFISTLLDYFVNVMRVTRGANGLLVQSWVKEQTHLRSMRIATR